MVMLTLSNLTIKHARPKVLGKRMKNDRGNVLLKGSLELKSHVGHISDFFFYPRYELNTPTHDCICSWQLIFFLCT